MPSVCRQLIWTIRPSHLASTDQAVDVSVFDLFKIGIGPSSSHTVGPMNAVREALECVSDLTRISKVQVILFGSLALTGHGHGTDKAVILGLSGYRPEEIDPDLILEVLDRTTRLGTLCLLGRHSIQFSMISDIEFRSNEALPSHPNALRVRIHYDDNRILESTYYSVGGGFIVREGQDRSAPRMQTAPVPISFTSAAELLRIGQARKMTIAEIVRSNEAAWRTSDQIDAGLDRIWLTMHACIERGIHSDGILPGGLQVKRRAAGIFTQLQARTRPMPLDLMDWVSLFAIAVNEENAAGGRVVTAPTNGASGIIPAVMRYYSDLCPDATRSGLHNFLLTAAAVGFLFKRNASISGADVGCQGEVGAACAMAAAGLSAALGGSNEQVENAAEIGIEHHLGMTCDPIGGFVQIPCIERNAMGAIKAINAASLALRGDGTHRVSLDEAIETVRTTGADMQRKYKETSLGGLAMNVMRANQVEC